MSDETTQNRQILKDICLPMTVGYHVEVEESSDVNRPIKRQDGFISGWVFLTLLMALAVTLSLGHWMTSDWSKSIDKPSIQICGIVMQLICCVVLLILLCRKGVFQKVSPSFQKTNFNQRGPMSKKCFQLTKRILPFIGIIVFLTGLTLLDILKVTVFVSCVGQFLHFDQSNYPKKEAFVAIFYHPMRIFFATVLTVFYIMHTKNKLCFYRYCGVRFLMLFVLSVVGFMWFDTLIQEGVENHVTTDAYSTHKYNLRCNSTEVDHFNNTRQMQCLCKTTDLFHAVKMASEVLYIFVIEFCLLVIECILHMLFTMVDTNPESDDGPNPVENGPENGEGDNREDPTTRQPLLTHPSVNNEAENESQENQIKCHWMCFVSFFLGLVYITMTLIHRCTSVNHSDSFKVSYYIFKFIYHILANVVTIVGFWACRSFRSNHQGYTGFEMLTLFTSFGFFVYVFFIFQAIIAEFRGAVPISPHPPNPTYLPALVFFFLDILVNIIQVCSQSSFMLHSSKIKPPANQMTQSSQNAIYCFKQVTFSLGVCNLFIWLTDSLLHIVPEIYPFPSIYYGEANWQMVSLVVFPLMIFYRFNSGIHLIETSLST